jgi:hypothetical protein
MGQSRNMSVYVAVFTMRNLNTYSSRYFLLVKRPYSLTAIIKVADISKELFHQQKPGKPPSTL